MLDVTMETASKFSQKLTDIPAAVYVLEGERIKRSGATTIAEALALVPGLRVSSFSAVEPNVSSRGFHGGLFNKMLVLQDGRSLYSPVYGGVYWADIDYLLEDIERIEVLRGPAGTIWGGNAENGVINIVTKSAEETQGGLVTGTYKQFGNYELGARQGIHLGDDVYGRAFYKFKSTKRDPVNNPVRWNAHHAGIVIEKSDDWTLRVGGEQSGYDEDIYKVKYENGLSTDISFESTNIDSYSYYAQFDKAMSISEQTDGQYRLWFQNNYDSAYDAPGKYLTIDGEASFVTSFTDEHKITYGLGYRFVHLDFTYQSQSYDFDDVHYYVRLYDIPSASDSIVNGFIQYEATWGEKLSTVVGAKLEYFEQNDHIELSPQARALYSLTNAHTLWAGIGRSAIAPSYMDTNSSYIANGIYCPQGSDCNANPNDYEYFFSLTEPSQAEEVESVVTYELGHRYASAHVELDSTIFFSQYSHISGQEFVSWHPDYSQIDLYQRTYDYEVDSFGVEIAAHWRLADTFTLYGAYSYVHLDQEWAPSHSGSSNGNDQDYYDIDGQHLASIQSLWSVTDAIEFDFVVKGQAIDYGNSWQLDNFFAVDARLGWQTSENAPLVELLIKNIGETKGYYEDIYGAYKQEQNVALRASYAY
ncbi:TonB-dependent receptor [Vibrio aquaticus]|uniref:TonB-dependent receptor n=2 Tax=Vibrio aquaticus TaxID=2496559 RepID=A0A3S0MMA8_9VIBR|nr:TonB-dependent receptor [Vibrio aquaticus]